MTIKKRIFAFKYAGKGLEKITINNKDVCQQCQNKSLHTIIKVKDFYKYKGIVSEVVKIIENKIYLRNGTQIIS